jgi:hypothetical protein
MHVLSVELEPAHTFEAPLKVVLPLFATALNDKSTSDALHKGADSIMIHQPLLVPPRAHRWQADVETVHRLIEDEFYEVEQFISRANFLAKAATYLLWFNVARKNSYKENQTPWQIIQAREPQISPRINTLAPLFRNTLFMQKARFQTQMGIRSRSLSLSLSLIK